MSAGAFLGLDTVLVRVTNIEAARDWYRAALGFDEPYVDPAERLAVFSLGGTTSLTLWELKPGESLPPRTQCATFPIFSVKDANETRELLAGRGVDVGPLVAGGEVTFFTFRDPDGNLLEACEVH
jgi:catechol 2,3-dioxygenase-like lactoylglutathione lyase family enzyme